MPPRAAASTAAARVSQQYAVSEDEEDQDLDQLMSDDEGDGDVKPPKGILHGALRPPRHVTMSTKQLHEMLHTGTVDLNPSYQRDVVWPESKMEVLIQSLFLNYYIPPIIFAVTYEEDTTQKRTTIDGKQRCTTIQRFMDGTIPYCAPDKKKYYYRKGPGQRGELLPQSLKTRFDMVSLVAVEYDGIADQTQRDIFQRVQLGVALSSAEKLQAIASPWSTWITEMCKKYVLEDNTLKDMIRWDVSRGKPFQALTAISIWCYGEQPVGGLTPPNYRRFLDRSDPPDDGFRTKMEKTMSIFVAIATYQHATAFDLPTIRGKGPRSPVSPVEFWFIGLIIFTRMHKSSVAGLARTIRDFRVYARSEDKDLFTNNKTVTKYKAYLDTMPVIRPGPNEQAAAVEFDAGAVDSGHAEAASRKRRRENREAEEDPDYRGGPIARGSKSDVVSHTRSKKPATAAPPAAAYQPRPTLPTIPTQRPTPSAMDAHVPTPALTATFGQPSPTFGHANPNLPPAPPPYAAAPQYMYSSQHNQQGGQRYNNYQTGQNQGYRPSHHGQAHSWSQR